MCAHAHVNNYNLYFSKHGIYDCITLDGIFVTRRGFCTLCLSSIAFTFSRTSAPYSLPLMSRLLVSNASIALNGTVITCVDRITSDMSSTIIRVVSQNQDQGR